MVAQTAKEAERHHEARGCHDAAGDQHLIALKSQVPRGRGIYPPPYLFCRQLQRTLREVVWMAPALSICACVMAISQKGAKNGRRRLSTASRSAFMVVRATPESLDSQSIA